jgi:integrase
MGRPADSPTPWFSDEHGCWVVRVTKPRPAGWPKGKDAPRQLVKLLTKTPIAREDVARAERFAKIAIREVRAGRATPEEDGETVAAYFDRWLAARVAKGHTATRVEASKFSKWIAPTIGHMTMAHVTRQDLEGLVRHLDSEVLRFDRATRTGLRWKTARNAWAVVSKMFADASKSKILDLRVRTDNPATDIEGPDDGAKRGGPFLYPLEFEALMACDRVPLRWKRTFALASYLYLRGGELAALAWADVNLDQGYVLVHQSEDETGAVGTTKTENTRKVPIEPTLLPLLIQMHAQAKGEGLVAAMPQRKEWSERLRKYLLWAGVTRAELTADDATRHPLTFHDLRHTGITWRAVRGDAPMKIMRAAGHENFGTTLGYVNETEAFEPEKFGTPFPSIPLTLFTDSGLDSGFQMPVFGGNSTKQADSKWPLRDLNPHSLSGHGF